MRIPASLVVMCCATAVPFGLAIRDTVRHTPRGDELDLTGEQTRAREARDRAAREEARARAEYEARLRERDTLLDSLFGKKPATLGVFFDGVTLGAPDPYWTDEASERIERAQRAREVEVGFETDRVLYAIKVEVPQLVCGRLNDRLVAAWGAPVDGFWHDPATHHRAQLSIDDCALVFDLYLDAEDWVAQLPFDLDAPVISFNMPGVGLGRGRPRINPEMPGGDRVHGINVTGETDLATQQRIRDALTMRLGVTPDRSVNDPNVWTWASKPAVRFDASGAARFSIQIGELSWQ